MIIRKGFTLIELLVVLAVIGLLASISVVSLSQANTNSRDARREMDIKELRRSLAIYETSRNRYPICSGEVQINGTSDCLSVAIIADGVTNVLPKDPRHGIGGGSCGDNGTFYYCYTSSNGSSYTIRYSLETNSILGKSQGWQTINP